MSVNDLREKLQNGIVSFTYKKKDGSIREANGTTRMDCIPEENHPKGTGEHSSDVVTYFDTDKNEWRSFREENFIHIIGMVQESHRDDKSNLI